MNISQALKLQRQRLNFTQEYVAREAGMNVTQYNGYERGRSAPAPDTIVRLAKALQTDVKSITNSAEERPVGEVDKSNVVRDLKDQFHIKIASELGLYVDDIVIRIEIL